MSKKSSGHRRTKKHRRHRRPVRPGAEPGTLIAAPGAAKPRIHAISYGPDDLVEEDVTDLGRLRTLSERWPVTWVNVAGLGDAKVVEEIGRIFGLHPLALEDVLNTHQRAKVEDYPEHLFLISRMTTLTDGGPEGEQLAMFLGKSWVITFQELEVDPLDEVRRRIREARPQIRTHGADYLAYAILDAVVDQYFPVLEHYTDELESLEEEAIYRATQEVVGHIHDVRRSLVTIRRSVWPLREALNSLLRDDHPLVSDATRIYLRDAYDHVVRILDILETDRDVVASLMDVYLSSMSNRMNEVMKVLTIIATIFIPLSFITGLYGMNFDHAISPLNMPELYWYYGYPAALLVMLVVALAMLLFFRHRGWIGSGLSGPPPPDEHDDGAPPQR